VKNSKDFIKKKKSDFEMDKKNFQILGKRTQNSFLMAKIISDLKENIFSLIFFFISP